jgi:hypothetical protein
MSEWQKMTLQLCTWVIEQLSMSISRLHSEYILHTLCLRNLYCWHSVYFIHMRINWRPKDESLLTLSSIHWFYSKPHHISVSCECPWSLPTANILPVKWGCCRGWIHASECVSLVLTLWMVCGPCHRLSSQSLWHRFQVLRLYKCRTGSDSKSKSSEWVSKSSGKCSFVCTLNRDIVIDRTGYLAHKPIVTIRQTFVLTFL